MSRVERAFPPYSYVPGLWPHPHSHPDGHRFDPPVQAADFDNFANDPTFQWGVDLFNSGYYWEAHEAWERLWHAAGRRGPQADLCKALIQLAVAGVKVREGRNDGVRTHARRAAELFSSLRDGDWPVDCTALGANAEEIATRSPPAPPEPRRPVEVVFRWKISVRKVGGEREA